MNIRKQRPKLRLLRGNPERKSLVLCSPLALLLTERGLLHLYLYIGGIVDTLELKKPITIILLKIFLFLFFSIIQNKQKCVHRTYQCLLFNVVICITFKL